MNPRRRRLLVAGFAALAGGCGRGDRIEATAHWLGVDHAFGSGILLASADGTVATVGFFAEPPPAAIADQMKRSRTVAPAMAGREVPWIALELQFKDAGRATLETLARYAVTLGGMGGSPVTFNRVSRDWVKDGSIDVSGEARAGARLLARVRRAGSTDVDGTERPYRWDLGFDATVSA